MEDNYREDMVLISRGKLERLEQDKNLLEVQLREERQKLKDERQKFKDSAKYSIAGSGVSFGGICVENRIYTNDELIYNNTLEINRLLKCKFDLEQVIKALRVEVYDLESELIELKSFWNLPLYKRLFLCLKRKR